jgi:hypothetical protein
MRNTLRLGQDRFFSIRNRDQASKKLLVLSSKMIVVSFVLVLEWSLTNSHESFVVCWCCKTLATRVYNCMQFVEMLFVFFFMLEIEERFSKTGIKHFTIVIYYIVIWWIRIILIGQIHIFLICINHAKMKDILLILKISKYFEKNLKWFFAKSLKIVEMSTFTHFDDWWEVENSISHYKT